MVYRTATEEQQRNRRVDSLGKTALNRQNQPSTGRAHYLYIRGVRLWERDMEILEGVAAFGSMSTGQIAELFFDGIKHPSSWYNVLNRLVRNGALSRVSLHISEKSRGGSPSGYYQIGKKSWRSFYDTPYKPMRDQYKIMHTILVVDTYIAMKRLERQGVLRIIDLAVEANAWHTIAGVEVHPDIETHLDLKNRREYRSLWLEVDNANEHRKQIQEKVERYIWVYKSGEYRGEVFPQVVFITRHEERVMALQRYIRQMSGVPDGLVTVMTMDSYVQSLM